MLSILLLLTLVLSAAAFSRFGCYLDSLYKKTAALLAFTLILAFIFMHVHMRAAAAKDTSGIPLKISGFIAVIDSVEKKRYNLELTFITDISPGKKARGLLTYTGRSGINPGSIIAVHKQIGIILPGRNSYLDSLLSQGYKYRGAVDDTDISPVALSPETFRSDLRERIENKINATFGYPSSGMINAVYFGDTSFIDKKTILEFRDAGVLHVLAASGMNIALVASIPLLLIPAGLGRRKLLVSSVILAALYLYITDMPVSLIRAAVMYFFAAAGLLLFRERNPFNALYLAGLFIALFMPWEVFNPGFQLSFGATAGILLFYRRYCEALEGLPGFLKKSLAVTFSAQVFAYPVIYIHMNQFNTIGFVTNIFIIPLITLIALLSLALLLLTVIIPAAVIPGAIAVNMLCDFVLRANSIASSFRMNFFTADTLLMLFVMLMLAAPLLDFSIIRRIKAYPVFIALIAATVILKHAQAEAFLPARTGFSSGEANISYIPSEQRLILGRNNSDKIDGEVIDYIRKKNPVIKIVEIEGTSYQNIFICRMLLNDFVISECIIHDVKELDKKFLELLRILQKEKIKVTIKEDCRG